MECTLCPQEVLDPNSKRGGKIEFEKDFFTFKLDLWAFGPCYIENDVVTTQNIIPRG